MSSRGPGKPQGFPKEERVRKSDEYTRILQEGNRVRGRFVNAYWTRDSLVPQDAPNRIGVAAGKKLGKAVLRNRLKRHLREAYRRNKRELPCRGIVIVFLASPRMVGQKWSMVQDDVRQLLNDVAKASQ